MTIKNRDILCANPEEKKLASILDSCDLQQRQIRRVLGTAICALGKGYSFTALTTGGIEGLFVIDASQEELVEKFQNISSMLDDIRDKNKSAWREEITRNVCLLLSADFAEANYLASECKKQLPGTDYFDEIFRYIFLRRSNKKIRLKISALLYVIGECPFDSILPQSLSDGIFEANRDWITFSHIKLFFDPKSSDFLTSILQAEKRIEFKKFVGLINEEIDAERS